MVYRGWMRVISLCLCFSLGLYPQCVYAQDPVFVPGATPGGSAAQGGATAQGAATVQGGPATPGEMRKAAPGLRILVLEGRMRVNRLTEGIFAMPVVEVRDGNDRPVEGAQVTFILNGGPGAGASFRDGSLQKTFSTNAAGQAGAEGYVPNSVEGKFEVRVKAVYRDESVEIVIPQANSFQTQLEADNKKAGAWKKWLWIGGIAAGGAIGTGIWLSRRGSGDSGRIVITPGPPVIGGR